MDDSKSTEVKSASEIGKLAKCLNFADQFYVLDTINFFLYKQNMQKIYRLKRKDEFIS